MRVIHVPSNIRDYEVVFEENTNFFNDLTAQKQSVFVVDENVWSYYSNTFLRQLPVEDTIIFPIDEERKNLDSVNLIYDQLINRNAKKNLTLITIGGGILQDITGFVASTLYRGIKWIFIPTTLLAQSDSCIGSKTSLNYRGFKNLIGTFYPPHSVHIFTEFLDTLQPIDYFSGLGEVVKLHIMGGEKCIQQFESQYSHILLKDPSILKEIIYDALRIKMSFICGDEFDQGKRNLLNYGHCFGHAIEATSDFKIPHGQAVVIGMILANYVAHMRGILSAENLNKLLTNVLMPALYVKPQRDDLNIEKIIMAMKKDKKRTGEGLPLIMIQDDFVLVKIDDLSETEAVHAVKSMADALRQKEDVQP